MREKIEIKKYYLILSVFVLALLLLISPCKVRNFIQAELGVPQTSVLNQSKTTISSVSCAAFELAETDLSSTTSETKVPGKFTCVVFFAFHFTAQSKVKKNHRISKAELIATLPLYILYQNFQVYL